MFGFLKRAPAPAVPAPPADPRTPPDPTSPSGSAAAGPAGVTTLRVGNLSALGTFDPADAEDNVSALILDQVFETLYAAPMGDRPVTPLLAAGPLQYTETATGALCRVPLRTGVEFSDGAPLTPDAVVASFRRLTQLQRRGIRVSAAGNDVLFELPEPNPGFLLALTHTGNAIVRPHGERLVGTGPYRLPDVSLEALARSGEPLVLERNPRAHKRAPIDVLEFHVYADMERLTEAIAAGEIDYTDVIPFEAARKLDRSRLRLSIQKGHSTGFLAVNTERVPDPLVRRTLLAAVDRSEIAGINFEGLSSGYIAGSLLPPMVALRERAVATGLFEAPASMPKTLTLLTTWCSKVYLPRPRETANAIRARLQRIGVDVSVHTPGTRAEFYDLQDRGAYDLVLAGWIADTPDPSDFYESMLSSTAVPLPGVVNIMGNNLARWKSPATDEALRAFRRSQGEKTNEAIASSIAHEGLYLPLLHGKVIAVYAWAIRGIAVSPLGRTLFASAER